jgi:hypothetical protein
VVEKYGGVKISEKQNYHTVQNLTSNLIVKISGIDNKLLKKIRDWEKFETNVLWVIFFLVTLNEKN